MRENFQCCGASELTGRDAVAVRDRHPVGHLLPHCGDQRVLGPGAGQLRCERQRDLHRLPLKAMACDEVKPGSRRQHGGLHGVHHAEGGAGRRLHAALRVHDGKLRGRRHVRRPGPSTACARLRRRWPPSGTSCATTSCVSGAYCDSTSTVRGTQGGGRSVHVGQRVRQHLRHGERNVQLLLGLPRRRPHHARDDGAVRPAAGRGFRGQPRATATPLRRLPYAARPRRAPALDMARTISTLKADVRNPWVSSGPYRRGRGAGRLEPAHRLLADRHEPGRRAVPRAPSRVVDPVQLGHGGDRGAHVFPVGPGARAVARPGRARERRAGRRDHPVHLRRHGSHARRAPFAARRAADDGGRPAHQPAHRRRRLVVGHAPRQVRDSSTPPIRCARFRRWARSRPSSVAGPDQHHARRLQPDSGLPAGRRAGSCARRCGRRRAISRRRRAGRRGSARGSACC